MMASYHMGKRVRASAEICVKGQTSKLRDSFQITSGLRSRERQHPNREGGSTVIKELPIFCRAQRAVQIWQTTNLIAEYSNNVLISSLNFH